MNGQGFFGHPYSGLYIAIDGIRCCGKSTQVTRLAEKIKLNYPQVELVVTKEPGGTEKANQIREVLVAKPEIGQALVPNANVLLFAASRAQSMAELIAPALREGKIVLSDRCVLSSDCYQASGDSQGEVRWQFIHALNLWAVEGAMPDLIIIPEISAELSAERQARREGRNNVYDGKSLAYFKRVVKAYHDLGEEFKENLWLIDGSASIENQEELVWEIIRPMVEENLEARREFLRGKERVY